MHSHLVNTSNLARLKASSLLVYFIFHSLCFSFIIYLYYQCGLWIVDEDRPFHTNYLVYGGFKNGEFIWGAIAPYFGLLFPDYPFEAFIIFTASTGYIAIARLTKSAIFPTIILSSAGAIELINESSRQAFAMMLFCLALTIQKKQFKYLFLTTTCFIHIIMLASLLHVALVTAFNKYKHLTIVKDYLSFLQFSSAGFVMYTVIFGGGAETALLLIIIQAICFAYLKLKKKSTTVIVATNLLFSFSAMFFLFTSAGIRGAFLFGMIAPYFGRDIGMWVAFLILWVYPIVLGRIDNVVAILPHIVF